MALFANDILPGRVEEDGLAYSAGAIKVMATKAVYKDACRLLEAYIHKHYGFFNTQTNQWSLKLPRQKRVEYEMLYSRPEVYFKVQVVLASSFEEISPATVLEWLFNFEDFFEKCYQEVVRLNPAFALASEPNNLSPDSAETASAKNLVWWPDIMEWLGKVKPDPFAKRDEMLVELPLRPDPVARLAGYVGLSWEDLNDFYVSELLGKLEGNSFKFKEGPNGWGQFSPLYQLQLRTWAELNFVLYEDQKFVREAGFYLVKSKFATREQLEQSAKRAKGMGSFMASRDATELSKWNGGTDRKAG